MFTHPFIGGKQKFISLFLFCQSLLIFSSFFSRLFYARLLFVENDIDIRKLDIPVNAVATALKEFFSKKLPPIFPKSSMNEIDSAARNFTDNNGNLQGFRTFLAELPSDNHAIIRFMIRHFTKYVFIIIIYYSNLIQFLSFVSSSHYRIVEKSNVNSMDSKNLSICWWPTLLQFEFKGMTDFEEKRPHLTYFIQILIDEYDQLFCSIVDEHSTLGLPKPPDEF